jgi:hypothetical protein
MGQHVECNRCLFLFCGDAICVKCLSRFLLPTARPHRFGGPTIGERIQLLLCETADRLTPEPGPRRWCHAKRHPIEPPRETGTYVVVVADEQPEILRYAIEEIPCPHCGSAALVAQFAPGDNCPQCNQGPLKIGVIFD